MIFNVEYILNFLFVGISVEVNGSLVVMSFVGVRVIIGGFMVTTKNHVIDFKYS